MPIHGIWRCSDTFYISNMNVGSSQWWSTVSTMSSYHHFIVARQTPICHNLSNLHRCKSVGVHPYATQTHSIYPVWMWEAVSGVLQPQQCRHAIISYPHWPQLTKIWANFARCNSVRKVHPYAYNSKWCCSNTFHTSNMDVESSQWWSTASTMSSCHRFIVATLTPNYQTVPSLPV